MSASTADVLTAIKNIVTAINAQTAQELAVNGAINSGPLSVATVVSQKAGRVARVSVTTAGTGTGTIYDSATATTTKPIAVIASAVGVQDINLPVSFGVYVVPSPGMVVTVAYS